MKKTTIEKLWHGNLMIDGVNHFNGSGERSIGLSGKRNKKAQTDKMTPEELSKATELEF